MLTTHNNSTQYGLVDADHPDYFSFTDFDGNGHTDVLEKRVASYYVSSGDLQDFATGQREAGNPIAPGTMLNSYRYFHNTGTGFAQYAYRISTGENFVVLDVGDFNGDGAVDLFVNSSGTGTTKICLSPLKNPANLGAPGAMITFACQPNLSLGGWGNEAKTTAYLFDAKGDGRSAAYSNKRSDMQATFCNIAGCQIDPNPPSVLGLNVTRPREWHSDMPEQTYTSLGAMVDFTGTGKPSDVRWSAATMAVLYADNDANGDVQYSWVNTTPKISITSLGVPGSADNLGPVAGYTYPEPPWPSGAPNDGRAGYRFDNPVSVAGMSADFNGSGYNSIIYGYIKLSWYGGAVTSTSADTTVCLSTGRALDCGVRQNASGAKYRAVQAVGNFVGDGQASVLMRPLSAGMNGTPTGAVEMCRLTGDDITNGTGSNEPNMLCTPWAGLTMPHEGSPNVRDKVYFMDLLGTGRQQVVYYHRGSYSHATGTWVPGAGWEVFEAVDVAKAGEALDRIVRVTNGLGLVSSAEYVEGLTSGVVSRTAGVNWTYPQQASSTPGKVVRALSVGNGVSKPRRSTYKYYDAATDMAGRGSLGYRSISTTDEENGEVRTSTFSQSWPLTGMVEASKIVAGNGVVVSDLKNILAAKSIPQANGAVTMFPFEAGSTTDRYDLNGSELGRAVVEGKDLPSVQYDDWGNLLNSKTTIRSVINPLPSFSTIVVNTYKPIDSANWHLGLVANIVNTKAQSSDGKSVTRVIAFEYEPNASNLGGKVKTLTTQPGDLALQVKTTNTHGQFGLVTASEVEWFDPSVAASRTRTNRVAHDTKGRYPFTITNALNQVETHDYYSGTGARQSLMTANNLITTWVADGFGRVSKETRPDGNETRSFTKACVACPLSASIARISDTFNGAARISVPVLEYLDNAGHVLRSQTWGFDGRAIIVDRRYDYNFGRLEETDHPRFVDEAAYLSSRVYYDGLGRGIKTVTKDELGVERASTTEFIGLVTKLTNAANAVRLETRNVAAQLTKVEDALGTTTHFEYEPYGNLSKTIDPNGNVITVSYDVLGRKTDLRDPDLGWIHYDVDPLGRTYAQISPKQRAAGINANLKTSFKFDALDRMTDRIELDLESHWVFDTATKGIGQLAEAYTGTLTAKSYQRLHTYDGVGRPSLTTQVLTDASYTSLTAYDAWGRVITQTYRRGGDAAKVFGTRYGNTGYQSRVERGALVLLQVTGQDASQRPTAVVLGNGLIQQDTFSPYTGKLSEGVLVTGSTNVLRLSEAYKYDALGSVSMRTQYWDTLTNGFIESFTYDALNRLKTSQVSSQAAAQNFTYDLAGNLTSKTGVGSGNYVYPTQGPSAVRPHAVQSIPGLGGFTYDVNGNQTSDPVRTTTWSSFDMPVSITKGTMSANFVYGPEHQRARQDRSDGSRVVYAGAQEVESKGGQVTVKTYWPGGIGVEIDRAGVATELNWTHTDRLGSLIGLTDQSGNLREKMSYDAWGKRRTLDGAPISGTASPDTIDGQVDNRGFTGHEMLDQLDLVHMNGRVYDPMVARFMSADLLLQDPMNGQSYNRYSYVMNNPTNFTDPTGFATCTGSRIEGVDTGACSPTAYATLTTDGKSVNYHSNKEDQSAAVKSGERALVYNKVNGKLMLPTGTGSANNGGLLNKLKDFGSDIWNSLGHVSIKDGHILACANNDSGCFDSRDSKFTQASANGIFSTLNTMLMFTPIGVESRPGIIGQKFEMSIMSTSRARTGIVDDMVFGPYHRLGDSSEAISAIRASGELVGNPARNYMPSPWAKVKAYDGPLPLGRQGFEFKTNVKPDAGHVPGQPVWMAPRAGVLSRDGQAVIRCSVVRIGC